MSYPFTSHILGRSNTCPEALSRSDKYALRADCRRSCLVRRVSDGSQQLASGDVVVALPMTAIDRSSDRTARLAHDGVFALRTAIDVTRYFADDSVRLVVRPTGRIIDAKLAKAVEIDLVMVPGAEHEQGLVPCDYPEGWSLKHRTASPW